MLIKSLIFDFDGLILDTETPEADVWTSIYAEHGFEFPMERWAQIIGGYGISDFDAATQLADLARDGLDPASLRLRHRAESEARILGEPVLPGVTGLLDEARRMGLGRAIASSSPHAWVDSHLSRLGLIRQFEKIICADDVAPGRTKPHPDLYLLALERTQAQANTVIAFEDSPNGVRAARAAGIFTVAVPNPVTSMLKFEGENLRLSSLEDFSFNSLPFA